MSDAPRRRRGRVGLIGRPNVGKSTLLNRILGQKLAITSHKAQTTRHAILGIRTRPEGQILFVDTPGIHRRGGDALNRYLNRAARTAVLGADALVFVLEALRWTPEDDLALETVVSSGLPAVAAVNKVDLVADKAALLPYLQALDGRYRFLELIPVSAVGGGGVEALERAVIAALPEGEPLYPEDQITDRSERFFASELLREQLVQRYGQELPYRTSVEIERFEDQGGRYVIHALIWVERPGQKAIVIGKGGAALKAVATQARLEMQKLFGCPVHLEVWVRVKKSWSSDEAALARLGYRDT